MNKNTIVQQANTIHSTILTKIKELVVLKNQILEKIRSLETKLQPINYAIDKLCPHQNVKHTKELDYHRYCHTYYCPVCKRDIGNDAYQKYCLKKQSK